MVSTKRSRCKSKVVVLGSQWEECRICGGKSDGAQGGEGVEGLDLESSDFYYHSILVLIQPFKSLCVHTCTHVLVF